MSDHCNELISKVKDLLSLYSEEELYIMGKDLAYTDRVIFYDCIKCIKENKIFKC